MLSASVRRDDLKFPLADRELPNHFLVGLIRSSNELPNGRRPGIHRLALPTEWSLERVG